MTLLASLATLVAAAATAAGGAPQAPVRGVQLAVANVSARIIQPAIVRQASGVEHDEDGPQPRIRRSGRTILVEYQ